MGILEKLKSTPRLRAARQTAAVIVPSVAFEGYLDEISATHVSGWVRDLRDAAARVEVTVVVEDTIARGIAEHFVPALANDSFGDAQYGFKIPLPRPLTPEECRRLTVHPSEGPALSRAPRHQGFLDERSVHHAAGWVRDRFDPAARLIVEAVLPSSEGEQILAKGRARDYYTALAQQGMDDGCYGFKLLFERQITEAERDQVFVRVAGTADALALSPRLRDDFEFLSFVALDIVNNCNLRCPFCLYDYEGVRTTRFMTPETFESALRLLPYAADAGFWLSCLHEPSLHPDFLGLLDRVPRAWRRKIMFTTNLAKRMPDAYYEALAASGVFHINISIESMQPALYERLRKGARWPIFKENWDRLINAWRAAAAPPRLRYIMMAYKANLSEIPGLVKFFREERLAWQVEVRHTYDMPHIPQDFAAAEYLEPADWAWLAEQLANYPADEVILTPPPPAQAEPAPVAAAAPAPAPDIPSWAEPPVKLPLNLQVEWNGNIIVCGRWDHPSERKMIAVANINELANPYRYLADLYQLPKIQGYVDELSSRFVSGWVRDRRDPDARIDYEVALTLPDETRIIGGGRANLPVPALQDGSFGDGHYGFKTEFPAPLTAQERDCLVVRPVRSRLPLERAPEFHGFVDERSTTHAAGWVRNRFNPDIRVTVEAVLPSGDVIATAEANQFYPGLELPGLSKVFHGFHLDFATELTESERDTLVIRPRAGGQPLDLSPNLRCERK